MAEPVRREFIGLSEMINYQNTYYARQRAGADFEAVRARVAEAVGAAPEEIALTRGATEALQLLISGYNRLRPGDSVLYADLDYDSMQYAMNALKARRGVDVVKFEVPEPATRQAVLDAYARALEANPKTRLLLLTHDGGQRLAQFVRDRGGHLSHRRAAIQMGKLRHESFRRCHQTEYRRGLRGLRAAA